MIWSIGSCSDQMIKGEVTWQRKERPIARGIKTVDIHLSEGVRGAPRFVSESFSK